MEKIKVRLADKSDDPFLNKILRDNNIGGSIRIAFQRNPSYFDSLKIEGYKNQVVIGRSEKNRIIGFGSRSLKKAYINGVLTDLGYLGNLRVIKGYKGKGYLHKGYDYFKSLHQDRKTQLYYSTIFEDNKIGLKILTSKKSYLPFYRDFGRYLTFAISLNGSRKFSESKLKIENGSKINLKKIAKFIQKNGARKQFYPYYTYDDFVSKFPGFKAEDFYVATRRGKIVGVIGRWDQRKSRQIIVTGYSGAMAFIRPFYNFISMLKGASSLPKPNTQINIFYVSFIAIERDDPEILRELIRCMYKDFSGKGYSHFLIGFHSNDRLIEALEGFTHIKIKSRLFVVHWEDGEKAFKHLDSRVPYVELATL